MFTNCEPSNSHPQIFANATIHNLFTLRLLQKTKVKPAGSHFGRRKLRAPLGYFAAAEDPAKKKSPYFFLCI